MSCHDVRRVRQIDQDLVQEFGSPVQLSFDYYKIITKTASKVLRRVWSSPTYIGDKKRNSYLRNDYQSEICKNLLESIKSRLRSGFRFKNIDHADPGLKILDPKSSRFEPISCNTASTYS
jgi:hypothetical protein